MPAPDARLRHGVALSINAQSQDPLQEFDLITLEQSGQPTLALHQQPAAPGQAGADVLYVHGATFGAGLSVFCELDGQSWATALNQAGLNVWGLDFAGFGASDRYAPAGDAPAGRLAQVLPQLQRAVQAIRQRNGDQPVALVAHSWGAAVAGAYAAQCPQDVKALTLFGPVTTRTPLSAPGPIAALQKTPIYPLSVWAQYRRFVEDVPRGQPQVLSEAHFQAWSAAFLASDPTAQQRMPPSVLTPYGPVADILSAWSGHHLYDPGKITMPALLVRGEWDSLCTDDDAQGLLAALKSNDKTYTKIERATHMMHLEAQRSQLHAQVNAFLQRIL